MAYRALRSAANLKALMRLVLPYIVTVAILAILLALTMTFRKCLSDYSAGTLQGLFIALISVVIYVAYQEASMGQERLKTIEKVKSTLSNELSAIKSSLDEAVRLKESQAVAIPHVDLATDVMRSVINSGKFTLLETELQLKLSHVYAVVDRAQDYLSRMKDFVASPALALSGRDKIFARLSANFWGQAEHLRQVIPDVLEKLQETG